MRLLQLVTDEAHLLDLHPQVSVIRSLDPDTRLQLAATVTGLARHEISGTGLLEAHGVLFDLDPALLSLLDRRADVDPIVRAVDIPGAARVDDAALREQEAGFNELLARIASAVEGRERALSALEAAATAVDQARRAVEEARGRRQELEAEAATERAEVEAARALARVERQERAERSVAEAREARWEALARLEDARRARAEADERLAEAEAELGRRSAARDALLDQQEELRRRLDPAAKARLEEARAALLALGEGQEPVPAAPVDDGPGSSAGSAVLDPGGPRAGEEAAALAARLAVLEEILAELDQLDPERVEAALAEAKAPSVLVPSAEAAALADQLASVEAELAAAEVPELSADESATAAERLDEARAAVADAEDAARTHHLTPEDAVALEAAHARLHDALERSDSRLGGIRARSQVDRLRAEEQELLDRLGFVTYAEYLMGTAAAHRDPQAETALAEARQRLSDAEDAWRAVEAQRSAVLAHAQLLDRRRQLTAAGAALLGRPLAAGEDLVAALRTHQVPAVGDDERARSLAQALLAAGVELDPADVDQEDLEVVAEAWLEEARQAGERRAALERDRDEAEAALAIAASRATDGDLAEPSDPPPGRETTGATVAAAEPSREGAAEATTQGSLDLVRTAAEVAQDRWEAHETVVAGLAVGDAVLEELTTSLAEAEQALALARTAAGAAETAEASAERSVAAVDTAPEGSGADDDPDETSPVEPPEDLAVAAAREAEAAAEAAVQQAEAAHAEAQQALEATERDVAELTRLGEAAAAELEGLQERHRSSGDAPAPDPAEIEWYLVARVAAQRSVSVAGSAPLLLEDPFGGLSEREIHHLLGRLERVAETVQIIVLSDHPAVAAWAEAAGEARAALVEPTPA